MKSGKKRKILKSVIVLAAIVIVAVVAIAIAEVFNELNVRFVPGYEQISLDVFQGVDAESLTGEDFDMLFRQAGLGRDAVLAVFNSSDDTVGVLNMHQHNFFNPPQYTCKRVGAVTREERFYTDEGWLMRGFALADVRNGDILVTKATHTLGWRHGHAGIVIDAERGVVLEAIFKGRPSAIQNISHWQAYPTFIQLRLRNEEISEQAAIFASENLTNVYYSLFAGLFPRFESEIRSTQCAHLPWYAYMYFGYDLDSSGIWPVTPRGISNSEHLEIVQIFGVDPGELWR